MTIFTDGSCRANGKIEVSSGGFGVIEVDDSNKFFKAYGEYHRHTTNNRMELMAILYAMKKHGNRRDIKTPIVFSDSAYCVNTYTIWMFTWASNGWRRSNDQIPENLDIIQEYYDLYQKGYRIDLRKVGGHRSTHRWIMKDPMLTNGTARIHDWNELADYVATGKIHPDVLNDPDGILRLF